MQVYGVASVRIVSLLSNYGSECGDLGRGGFIFGGNGGEKGGVMGGGREGKGKGKGLLGDDQKSLGGDNGKRQWKGVFVVCMSWSLSGLSSLFLFSTVFNQHPYAPDLCPTAVPTSSVLPFHAPFLTFCLPFITCSYFSALSLLSHHRRRISALSSSPSRLRAATMVRKAGASLLSVLHMSLRSTALLSFHGEIFGVFEVRALVILGEEEEEDFGKGAMIGAKLVGDILKDPPIRVRDAEIAAAERGKC